MKKLLLCAVLALAVAGCSDSKTAQRVLAQQGYTQIETLGPSLFGCSENDTFTTKFRAVSPAGVLVTGVVCSGWLKGATIRFD